MKLSEYQNEDALDILADIIEPAAEIFADKEVSSLLAVDGSRLKAVRVAIKNHKRAIIEILAALDGTPVDSYKCNVLTLPAKVLEILNDKELMQLFTFAEQTGGAKSSGSATESTEAVAQ